QRRAEAFRALELERTALERERGELGQQLAQASQERAARAVAEWAATAAVGTRAQQAAALELAAAEATEQLERARRQVAELKERETRGRATRGQTEEALAQVAARRDALAELERQRVGLAPAAQALLKEKTQFGDAVIGPLSDFVRTGRRDAELAEQLLGEWLHAVLVRDAAAVDAVRRWHDQAQPGPLVLLPSVPGPALAADGHPLQEGLRVDGPAAAWVHALLAGHEELESAGSKGDAERAAAHAQREAADATVQVERLSTRLSEVEARLTALRGEVDTHEVERVRLDERLGGERQRLVELETGQEAAREQRVKWQVDAAQVEARLASARERAARAAAETDEARHQVATLVEEIAALDHDTTTLTAQQAQWEDTLKERRVAVGALEAAARDAEAQVAEADARLARSEGTLDAARTALEARGAQEHKLELERTEIPGARRGLVAQIEA